MRRYTTLLIVAHCLGAPESHRLPQIVTIFLIAQRRQDAEGEEMHENDVSATIVDAAYKVHTTLGPGLLETVYEAVLAYELTQRGLRVERQVPIAINYENIHFDVGFRADMLVEGLVIVELKSVERVLPVHKKQVLTYIRLADLRLGLLMNFGASLIKDGITRLVNRLEE